LRAPTGSDCRPKKGARALEQVQKHSVAVRKNMERLRALSLQKEASSVQEQVTEVPRKPNKRSAPK
jgi:hypothetical protein